MNQEEEEEEDEDEIKVLELIYPDELCVFTCCNYTEIELNVQGCSIRARVSKEYPATVAPNLVHRDAQLEVFRRVPSWRALPL